MRRILLLLLALLAAPAPAGDGMARATFGGGCFWCMEPPYDAIPGVVSTTSGYTGGAAGDANYRAVSAGGTGHVEVVQVTYDPDKVSYEALLEIFWRNIDPLARDRQFCDSGSQYRSAIFVHDEAQGIAAQASLERVRARFDAPVHTTVEPLRAFYPAEDYHQDYYRKNPIRYKYYRWGCGRDQRLAELWGDEG